MSNTENIRDHLIAEFGQDVDDLNVLGAIAKDLVPFLSSLGLVQLDEDQKMPPYKWSDQDSYLNTRELVNEASRQVWEAGFRRVHPLILPQEKGQ